MFQFSKQATILGVSSGPSRQKQKVQAVVLKLGHLPPCSIAGSPKIRLEIIDDVPMEAPFLARHRPQVVPCACAIRQSMAESLQVECRVRERAGAGPPRGALRRARIGRGGCGRDSSRRPRWAAGLDERRHAATCTATREASLLPLPPFVDAVLAMCEPPCRYSSNHRCTAAWSLRPRRPFMSQGTPCPDATDPRRGHRGFRRLAGVDVGEGLACSRLGFMRCFTD